MLSALTLPSGVNIKIGSYYVNYSPLAITSLKWELLISLAAFKAYRFHVPAVPAVPIYYTSV
jgi:hypothetical protein